jgi:hypothetical protein
MIEILRIVIPEVEMLSLFLDQKVQHSPAVTVKILLRIV